MLTIRLARTGRKQLAHYKVVAADSRRATTGKFVAQLGNYNPHTKELVIDEDRTQKYIDSGAQPSSRMVRILKDHKGIKLPEWAVANLVTKPERPKEEETEEAESTAEPEKEAEKSEAAGEDTKEESKEETEVAEPEKEAEQTESDDAKDEDTKDETESKPDKKDTEDNKQEEQSKDEKDASKETK